MIRCCSCKKEYNFEGNIFEVDKNTNCPILICPHCGFKHAINFLPFDNKIENLKKVEKIELTTVYYPSLGASRIADASRVDQSGADDGDVTGWVKTADFILATRIYGSKGAYNFAYKLKWRNVTDSGTFADVGATGEISFTADTVLGDGTTLTSGICGAQAGYTWQNGLESEGDNILPDSGTYSLADEYYTELQWALDCDGATDGETYEFALYELTNGTSIGTCLSSITMAEVAGPTEKSIAGSLYAIGAVGKKLTLTQIISGAINFAGSVIKTLPKLFAGVLNFAGSMVRNAVVSRVLTGAVSFARNAVTLFRQLLSITGTLNFSGAITNKIIKNLVGILNSSGSLAKVIIKGLFGAISFTGITIKNISISLMGGISFIANVVKKFFKTIGAF